jgi:hypothetical protein
MDSLTMGVDDRRTETDENTITTTHALDFEVAPWDPNDTFLGRLLELDMNSECLLFRVGTVDGLWTLRGDTFAILSIVNTDRNNGHLEDVMQWFYFSCYHAEKHLLIEELMNPKFKEHLINKRGFQPWTNEHLIKFFSDIVDEYDELMEGVVFNADPETYNQSR